MIKAFVVDLLNLESRRGGQRQSLGAPFNFYDYVLFRAGLQVRLGDVAYDTASHLLEGQAFKRK